MSIANVYVEPGVYSQFKPSTSLPVAPGGLRVAALVGEGRLTNIISSEAVVKGVEDSQDTLAHAAVALSSSIVDEDYNTYTLGIDYQLTAGVVDWSLSGAASHTGTIVGPFAGLMGKVFKATIASGTEQVITFSNTPIALTVNSVTDSTHLALAAIPATLHVGMVITQGSFTATVVALNSPVANTVEVDDTTGFTAFTATTFTRFVNSGSATTDEVVNYLNDSLVDALASNLAGAVKITTTADNNTTLLIGNGDANLVFGMVDGTLAVTPREPAAGKVYNVGYTFDKVASDYIPKFYYNMDDVVADFGEVSTANYLSLGAEIVFQHGASVVCLVQCDPADGALVQQFRKAIDKLLAVSGINIVVALSPNPTLFSYLKTHVDTASSLTERKERTAILGMSGTPTLATIMGYAQGLDSKRLVLVNPTSATRYVGTDTTVSTLDGSFLAAAIAGIRTSVAYDVAEPLTRKEIVGFEAIPDVLMRSEKNQLAAAGVCLIESVGGIPRVRHGITTDTGTVDAREYSVVEVIDYVGSSMRQLLETIFIGQKILAETPSQVRSTISAILANLVTRQVIVAFDNIQASIDNTDPTQINVSFRISPVFPLNYILISFSLSL